MTAKIAITTQVRAIANAAAPAIIAIVLKSRVMNGDPAWAVGRDDSVSGVKTDAVL